jgi:hypothetical protein
MLSLDIVGDDRTWDHIGNGLAGLEVKKNIQKTWSNDALVFVSHVPAAIWSFRSGLDLQTGDNGCTLVDYQEINFGCPRWWQTRPQVQP